jgi:hypothetical protein
VDRGGYRQPPGWEDEEGPERFAPKGKRQLTVRIEQVQIMFPVDSDAEYQWRFADGTTSIWKAAPNKDLLRAPPGAKGIFWRRRGERARRTEARGRGQRATPTAAKKAR